MAQNGKVNHIKGSSMENKITKYPITKAYQVFLRCPGCGNNMKCDVPPWTVKRNKVTFNYVCPWCSSKALSDTQYPYQQFEFDLSQGVVEEE